MYPCVSRSHQSSASGPPTPAQGPPEPPCPPPALRRWGRSHRDQRGHEELLAEGSEMEKNLSKATGQSMSRQGSRNTSHSLVSADSGNPPSSLEAGSPGPGAGRVCFLPGPLLGMETATLSRVLPWASPCACLCPHCLFL